MQIHFFIKRTTITAKMTQYDQFNDKSKGTNLVTLITVAVL